MQDMDLQSVLWLLLTKIKWIIMCALIGALLLGSYAHFFVPEKYTSSVYIYIRNLAADANASSATSSNLSASERLTRTFQIVITTDPVIKTAAEQLDGRITTSKLKSMVSTSLIQDTAFLCISATDTDKKLAQEACQAMAKASTETFSLIEEVGSVTIVDSASPARKTSPNVKRNAAIGAIIGALVSMAFFILRTLLDNTIHDREDLLRHLDVPILGEIPSFGTTAKGGRSHER